MTGEKWVQVVGYEGLYSVSSLGRVRSEERTLTKSNGRKHHVRERILKQSLCGPERNYAFVVLSDSGMQTPHKVHRLVLLGFRGSAPEGTEGCHNDGDSLNNQLGNLRWGTRSSNIRDQVAQGTHYSHGRTRTHCPQGHPYDETNTGRSPGVRWCRACKRQKNRTRRMALNG